MLYIFMHLLATVELCSTTGINNINKYSACYYSSIKGGYRVFIILMVVILEEGSKECYRMRLGVGG